jgi:hypothetical protein
VERLVDELFADVGAVRVSGINEVGTELYCAAQYRFRLVAVGGRTPDAGTGDPHGTESEAVDR